MNSAQVLLILSACLAAGACRNEAQQSVAPAAAATTQEAERLVEARPENVQPKVVVYKNASCGCCNGWIEHMQTSGFPVEAHDLDNLGPVKERVGVPHGLGSCHTAEVDGYFIEGHVPAPEVQRLLAERPKAKGLTVPAMPIGSPGMEQGDRIDPYDVLLVHEDGTTSVYAHYPK
jgi:hypothetical protein